MTTRRNLASTSSHRATSIAGRLAAAAEAATMLVASSSADLNRTSRINDWPTWEAHEILPGLFQGGTAGDDTIGEPKPMSGLVDGRPYDVVVTLYAWAQPVGWEVEELRYGFGDGALEGTDLERVLRAARFAYDRWIAGDRVLVRCQAGVNRSGLVTSLVLILAGLSPAQAITLIRAQRSSHALCNQHFVTWLFTDALSALEGARGHSDPSPTRAA